jgi:hypothetical protein
MGFEKFKAGIGLAILLLALSGCGPGTNASGTKLTRENFDQIRAGMHRKDVEGVLGKPTSTIPHKTSLDAELIWKDGKREIRVMFEQSGFVRARGSQVVKEDLNLD